MGMKPILSLAMTILSLESGPEGPRVRGSPPATVAEVAADGPPTSIPRHAKGPAPAAPDRGSVSPLLAVEELVRVVVGGRFHGVEAAVILGERDQHVPVLSHHQARRLALRGLRV